MPKAKKGDKERKAERRARKDAKQTKKADKKEKKGKSKDVDSDDDADMDLDAVLKDYAKQQEQFLKITEELSDPPSARSSAALIASPETKELFLFGGEVFNGALVSFFNDLFVYLINKGIWRRVTSPNSPLPRSGHAICRGSNGLIYVSMGEFSSPKQGTFHHYNDLWSLAPSSREWTRLEPKGKTPPARSGHRMVAFKDYLVLFGGFQDTSQQTKYLQDLWVYDVRNFMWHSYDKLAQKPDPRSSFSFLPHEKGTVLFGGYSRVKATTKAGAQTKGGSQATKNVLKPMVHQDSWLLRMAIPTEEAPAKTAPTAVWERRKRPANVPNPARAGATMVWHKGRGISFGGVHDIESSEEGIDSEFFDSIFAWNIDRNRFFPLTLRRARAQPKKAQGQAERSGRRGRGKADEEELLKNLAALNAQGSVAGADSMEIDVQESDESDEEEDPLANQPVSMTLPHPRFNAQLAVYGDTLFIYGGTFEKGDQEFTFDEMHAIDLGKLDGVKQIFRREFEAWVESEDEDEDESEDEDEDEDPSDEEMDDQDGASARDETTSINTAVESIVSGPALVDEEEQDLGVSLADDKPHPRPFETLRDFFARTSTQWQEVLLQELRAKGMAANKFIKELRKDAFMMAEDKWWDCREEIQALEDQQEESGIGEVVSLADRGDQGGGAGRRR